jgi:bisphosphoglycerate-independent phosphoglycerate mutase (AlkP superfamily)
MHKIISCKEKDIITEGYGRTVQLIIDGLGTNPAKEEKIIIETWNRLPGQVRARLMDIVRSVAACEDDAVLEALTKSAVSRTLISVLQFESIRIKEEQFPVLKEASRSLRRSEEWMGVNDVLKAVADEHNYAPWSLELPMIDEVRNDAPFQFLIDTSGVNVGMPKMKIVAQGDSDKGHQNIFNLIVAEQFSKTINEAIASGSFFQNQALNQDLCSTAEKPGGKVIFKTLLSGEFGDDGYIHSAWPHMEGFLKLYFEELHLPKERLLIEAVLDGRDSPEYSSLREVRDMDVRRYGFLNKLIELLQAYDAEECLAWIVGRATNDRDYKGANIKKEYLMLTRNEVGHAGIKVKDRQEAIAFIKENHAKGVIDAAIPPIVIGEHGALDNDTLFFNGIFRADRQEPLMAVLGKDKEFISKKILSSKEDNKDKKVPKEELLAKFPEVAGILKEFFVEAPIGASVLEMRNDILAANKPLEMTENKWSAFQEYLSAYYGDNKKKLSAWERFSWVQDIDPLVWSMASYNAKLEQKHGFKALFKDDPLAHNVLKLLNVAGRKEGFPFNFKSYAETTKEKHVQKFARGKDSNPIEGSESSVIIPSYGPGDGVKTDDDFYKTPQMRHAEIAEQLIKDLDDPSIHLFFANFSGPDMIGHTIAKSPDNYLAVKKTLSSVDMALNKILFEARQRGFNLAIVSDHGNAENYGPDHGAFPIVYSVYPNDHLQLNRLTDLSRRYKLTDTAWTLANLLGVEEIIARYLPPIPEHISAQGLTGSPLLGRRKTSS